MRGFTLIELLIVITILVVISALALPFAFSFQGSTNLATHADAILSNLRRAQQQAHSGQNADGWGVYFNTAAHQLILFKGQSYASRDTAFDVNTDWPETVTLTTDFSDEISFALYSGAPSASGTVQLINQNSEQRNIVINGYGKIQTDN